MSVDSPLNHIAYFRRRCQYEHADTTYRSSNISVVRRRESGETRKIARSKFRGQHVRGRDGRSPLRRELGAVILSSMSRVIYGPENVSGPDQPRFGSLSQRRDDSIPVTFGKVASDFAVIRRKCRNQWISAIGMRGDACWLRVNTSQDLSLLVRI